VSPVALVAITFGAVLAIFFLVYWLLIARPEATAARKLEQRMKPQAPARQDRLRKRITELPEQPAHPMLRGLQNVIDQSGLKLTLPALLFICTMSGFGVGFLIFVFLGSLTVAAIAGGICVFLPYLWVKHKATSRMWKFEEQFPEAIDLIARALRSGHALPTGLSMVAEEISPPVGPEFRLLFDQQNFGKPLPDALRAFGQRVPVLDARFFITAVLTQREAGGDLAVVLDNLAKVIRERFRVRREIKTKSAHGRMTAAVLIGLPPAVAAFLSLMAPENAALLFYDPTGQILLGCAAGLQLLGMIIIRKIINIEY
jgi:tight adherence protein B